jgi:hypothetical protein
MSVALKWKKWKKNWKIEAGQNIHLPKLQDTADVVRRGQECPRHTN